ncbi:shufflon system plasmid conjugative transfer pilus tip adhesin PilV, partial [Cronobacter sakazakii]|uniref:shufflon system plasmid conjugative transfer pilus tip adhesin PilV n=1 Tax=Cronobacter sakazakii TaxID=28141 RepID=UPI001EFE4DCA
FIQQSQAVKSYTGRYYDTLLSSATTTTPVTVTPAMLKNTGFLEQGFSETTVDGQAYLAAVVRNATNTDQLQALVYTQNGAALPFLALRQISMDITSGMGGYIWTSGTATGAMGSWTIPLSQFGISTTQGHIAALLTTDELGAARGENDRLYRFSVTGKPDLNTMHTSIDMGGNNLNNAGTINAVTGNFSGDVAATGNITANGTVTGQNVTAGSNVTAGNTITANNDIRSNNGWFITRGSKGWLNETYGGGFYMSDNDWVRVINNKNIYTSGQVRGGSVRADGRLSTGEVLQLDGVNTAGAVCSPNGLVSRDATGAILSCQSGVWTAASKIKMQTVFGETTCANKAVASAYCPSGTVAIGGSYALKSWSDGSNHNSPDSMVLDPVNDRFYIVLPNNSKGAACFQAIANCATN